MKRKLLILLVCVVLLAVISAGTVAYFSSEGTAHNVITTGGVNIALHEWANAEKTQEFENLDGIMPGTSVTKIVEIENTGKSDAWIRVSVEKAIELAGNEKNPDLDIITLDINTASWTLKEDGYLYYNSRVKPGEITAPVFTTVSFDSDMENKYQSAEVTVKVVAQAVQCANNGTTVFEAQGWGAE